MGAVHGLCAAAILCLSLVKVDQVAGCHVCSGCQRVSGLALHVVEQAAGARICWVTAIWGTGAPCASGAWRLISILMLLDVCCNLLCGPVVDSAWASKG